VSAKSRRTTSTSASGAIGHEDHRSVRQHAHTGPEHGMEADGADAPLPDLGQGLGQVVLEAAHLGHDAARLVVGDGAEDVGAGAQRDRDQHKVGIANGREIIDLGGRRLALRRVVGCSPGGPDPGAGA
jgi:hypothetical protein